MTRLVLPIVAVLAAGIAAGQQPARAQEPTEITVSAKSEKVAEAPPEKQKRKKRGFGRALTGGPLKFTSWMISEDQVVPAPRANGFKK